MATFSSSGDGPYRLGGEARSSRAAGLIPIEVAAAFPLAAAPSNVTTCVSVALPDRAVTAREPPGSSMTGPYACGHAAATGSL